LLVSGLLLLTSRVERVASRAARPWLVLAAVFGVLAVDEAVGFHELTTEPLRAALDTGGLLHLAWVLPAMAAVGVFVLAHVRFLVTLPRTLAVAFVVAGACYVGGAIGMEMVDGAYLAARGDQPDLGYDLLTGIEEGLEMIGILLLVRALIHHIVERTTALLVTVD
nr:hypothetical protein [Acidimicrobiia bacterium]